MRSTQSATTPKNTIPCAQTLEDGVVSVDPEPQNKSHEHVYADALVMNPTKDMERGRSQLFRHAQGVAAKLQCRAGSGSRDWY